METLSRADLRPRTEKRLAAKADSRPRTTLSFYRYVQLKDPEEFRLKLLSFLTEIECLGRIYVAHEGINAQMNVLTSRFEEFDTWAQAQPELQGTPYKLAIEEGEVSSFYKLTIKVKEKIVADGLDEASFDVTDTGAYLTAAEINEYVDNPDAVVIDMRNNYESEVGHFEGAITPNVATFRDELKKTPELLKVYKNKKIALYCTGGIRCEKASAWLKHNGFTDVRHLKGGIIDYAHQVKAQGLPNKFRGKNFVFDERLGERVGEEIIATCHLCRKTKSDTHHHCQNEICNLLFIGCGGCIEKGKGYCSTKCDLVDRLPIKTKKVLARFYNRSIRKHVAFSKSRLAEVR